MSGGAPQPGYGSSGQIVKIGGNDGGAIVVVARIEDKADRVPDPFGWLDCSQFVECQHLGLEDRPQNFQFGGVHGIVVRVLDFLQQLAVIIKQAGNALADDQLLDHPDSEMRLAHANRPDQQQSSVVHRIFFNELAGGHACRR